MDSVWQCDNSKQMENRPRQGASTRKRARAFRRSFRRAGCAVTSAGKLRRDDVFRAAYELLREAAEPILDVGCGIGLLAVLSSRTRGVEQPVTGLDVDANKVQHARAATAKTGYSGLTFLDQDVGPRIARILRQHRSSSTRCIISTPPRRKGCFRNLPRASRPAGCSLLRDCPRDRSARFWATYLGEIFAQTVSWNIGGPLHFPTRASINEAFGDEMFAREERAMFGGGPFNNRLFIFRRRL